MSIKPSRSVDLILQGNFSFSAKPNGGITIVDSYQLKITFPVMFPHAIPRVIETGKKIPCDGQHHVNSDNTLCLGSPLRLLKIFSEKPSIVGFAENCLVPFLYAVSNKLQNGGSFVFNELPHGEQGIIDDYLDLFGLDSRASNSSTGTPRDETTYCQQKTVSLPVRIAVG